MKVELMMPNSVELSVFIGVGGCWWQIYATVVCSDIVICPLWTSDTGLISAYDAMT